MSGGKKFAGASQAETDLISLGKQQIAQGRALEQPNLLHLKEVATISASDRANAEAQAKAQGAESATQALRQGLSTGMRRGGTSGAALVGNEAVTSAMGHGNAMSMVDTAQNLDSMDLQSKGSLAQQALTGAGSALEGLRGGVSGIGAAELYQVQNRNLKAEQDANTFTNLALGGLKGAGMLGAKAAASGATTGFGAAMNKIGLVDRNHLDMLNRRAMNQLPVSSNPAYNSSPALGESLYDRFPVR